MSVCELRRAVGPGPERWGFLVGALHLLSLLALSTAPLASQEVAQSPHGALPEALGCAACHTAEGWTPLRDPLGFRHGDEGGFPLTGFHETVACVGCHLDLRFDDPFAAPDDCASCHLDIHEGRMVDSCAVCHTTTSFQEVEGDDVHARTSFALTGAHRQISCEACHVDDVGGAFSELDPDCVSCHREAYEGALTVDHEQSGYPTDCAECHSTLGWNDAPIFDHPAVANGFTLLGAHGALRCASCHSIPGMEPLFNPAGPEDCVSCHQADYDHEHGGSGFPTTCLSCHDQDNWDDAGVFDHASTGFLLSGAHVNTDCTECHGPPVNHVQGMSSPDDCVACHQAEYDAEHGISGFSTECAACHTSDGWLPSTFDHDGLYFPIFSGKHQDEWSDCAECHESSPGYSTFSCVNCHEHTRQESDDEHSEVADYVYESNGCYSCHPRGDS
jgi:hypothetical protein